MSLQHGNGSTVVDVISVSIHNLVCVCAFHCNDCVYAVAMTAFLCTEYISVRTASIL